jgi:hypothetical protein
MEPNYTTARKPGPLEISRFSLVWTQKTIVILDYSIRNFSTTAIGLAIFNFLYIWHSKSFRLAKSVKTTVNWVIYFVRSHQFLGLNLTLIP